jgi:hypothetical protein
MNHPKRDENSDHDQQAAEILRPASRIVVDRQDRDELPGAVGGVVGPRVPRHALLVAFLKEAIGSAGRRIHEVDRLVERDVHAGEDGGSSRVAGRCVVAGFIGVGVVGSLPEVDFAPKVRRHARTGIQSAIETVEIDVEPEVERVELQRDLDPASLARRRSHRVGFRRVAADGGIRAVDPEFLGVSVDREPDFRSALFLEAPALFFLLHFPGHRPHDMPGGIGRLEGMDLQGDRFPGGERRHRPIQRGHRPDRVESG